MSARTDFIFRGAVLGALLCILYSPMLRPPEEVTYDTADIAGWDGTLSGGAFDDYYTIKNPTDTTYCLLYSVEGTTVVMLLDTDCDGIADKDE